MITAAVKCCDIASNGDSLAGEGVVNPAVPSSWGLFDTLDGDIAIRLDVQLNCSPDGLGSGQGDDPFSEEGAARQQRAEEDEEPDA